MDPCALVAEPGGGLDTLTVALLEPVSMENATSPTNDSERLLYRNLFDNLIRLDCQGTVRPGLAESWRWESGGWVLTLGERAEIPKTLPLIDAASSSALAIDSVYELDDRRLRIVMRGGARDSVPRFLADPALVLRDGPVSEGSGGERSLIVRRRGSLPVIDFRSELEGDPRDRLDRDIDLLLTRDTTLVDYVANRAEFTVFPLPWSRAYVLAEAETGQGELTTGLNSPAVRMSLAKDAVRAGARPAEPPYWWNSLEGCPATAAPPSSTPSPRVVYRRDDEVSRGLAERIVGLASRNTGLRAVGLDPAEFATAIRDRSEAAYVIGLPRQSLVPCRDVALWPAGALLLPLVETRAYAIVRKGTPPLTVEWDGIPRVMSH